ncbi:hypothetical protein RRG08_065444 [Elysia crispata]|uniref:Uncharacterized protein n=1 Tax=Elysia crispata TaxID=231223 RepID=A0AAE0YIP1_9GAST|nr:hypothetical protein RRG08_065444 [Elysia crispata]
MDAGFSASQRPVLVCHDSRTQRESLRPIPVCHDSWTKRESQRPILVCHNSGTKPRVTETDHGVSCEPDSARVSADLSLSTSRRSSFLYIFFYGEPKSGKRSKHKRLQPPYGECALGTEQNTLRKIGHYRYSIQNCFKECLQLNIYERCGCCLGSLPCQEKSLRPRRAISYRRPDCQL